MDKDGWAERRKIPVSEDRINEIVAKVLQQWPAAADFDADDLKENVQMAWRPGQSEEEWIQAAWETQCDTEEECRKWAQYCHFVEDLANMLIDQGFFVDEASHEMIVGKDDQTYRLTIEELPTAQIMPLPGVER